MKKSLILLFLILFFNAITYSDEINWHTSITRALEDAEKQKKYIMIDVYTDWCTWCKELDKQTYTHPSVIQLSKNLINVKINPEKDEEAKAFLSSYPVDGYPTILFIDWKRKLIGKIGGFLAGKEFAVQADKILSSPAALAKFKKEHAEGNINSSEALITLLLELEYEDEAIAVIEELRLEKNLPEKIEYYHLLAFTYLSNEYYQTALTLFDYILIHFKSGEDFKDLDYYYKSAYYKGFALASLGKTEECRKLVEAFKDDEKNPYARYFEGLLEKK